MLPRLKAPLFAALLTFCTGSALAQDAAAAFAKGKERFQARDFAAAIAAFEKCLAENPKDSRYHQWFGRALGLQAEQAGMLKAMTMVGKIRGSFEKAVELDPANLSARQDLMVFYLAAPSVAGGSKEKAREQVEEIRKRDAAFGAQLDGDVAVSEKRFEEAKAAYNKAARLGPTRPAPFIRLALILQQEKRWGEAFAALDRALKIESRNALALYQVGRTGALSGLQLDRAETALRTYLTLRPAFDEPPLAAAHYRLGMVLEKKGNAAAARTAYETAMRLDPKNKDAKAALEKLGKG